MGEKGTRNPLQSENCAMRYDALKAPDPQDWLDLDEQERIDQVIDYHRRYLKGAIS
jgi:hypothetical protein